MNVVIGIGLWLVLTVLALGVGAFWLRKVPAQDALERVVFALPLGLGTVSLLVLALGLARQANPVALWGGVAALGVPLAALGFRRWGAGNGERGVVDSAATSPPPALPTPPLSLLVAAGFGLLGLATLAASVAPPSQWDELAYHLAVPKTYLREGRIFYIPYDHHSNFPFLIQMLYLLLLSAGSAVGAKLVHWLCGVLLVLSVASFCRRHFGVSGKGAGVVAAALVAGSPLVVWESTTAYIDLGSALFTWLAFYGLVNAAHPSPGPSLPRDSDSVGGKRGETKNLGWLVVSAVLMGFALGTKATVLGFWGMCLLGILGWSLVSERKWAKETLPHAALWAAISLGIGAVWYVKTFLYTGNLVYPFAYGVFGGRYWSAENAAQYAAEQAKFGFGKEPLALILSPLRVAFEQFVAPPEGRSWAFTEQATFGFDLGWSWLLALLPAPFLLKKLPRPAVYSLLFAGGIWIFWFFVMQQGRYLIPALAALAVGAAGVWMAGGRWVRLGISVAAGLGLVNGLAAAGKLAAQGIAMTTSGKPAALAMGAPGAAENWINENSQPGEKVALLDEVRGFYLNREYVWAQPDHAEGLIPWDSYTSADDWLADFKRKKYIWILAVEPAGKDGRRWRKLFAEALFGDKIVESASFHQGTQDWKVYKIR